MTPQPFHVLMETALREYSQEGSVFGVRKEKFYRNQNGAGTKIWGTELASPIGPAAGPNTQLAQNIAAAFLAGSRVIELKTVQIMDGEELRNCVARPCINAADECYNVEWSTELTVRQAMDEYVKAWFLVHALGIEYGLDTGVIFNMSVGYSLEGIKSKKIDSYIEGMKQAGGYPIWRECREWLLANLDRFERFGESDLAAISETVSDSITLSTLHGCPANEIEQIADYLLTEKLVHTYVKCNPTLLGYGEARSLLDSMGYGYISFDERHFKEDLQFADAVAMIGRLSQTAEKLGLCFGAKITNTFPVDIRRGELPGDEMYMSGRALFPLSLTVAARLSEATGGKLAISYSGGADAFNLSQLLESGVKPVTFATTILKPGGYERICQLASIAESAKMPAGAFADHAALTKFASGLDGCERYRKEYREGGVRKNDNPLPLFDCGSAPCSADGCPIGQQIPAFLEQISKGDFQKAFDIIVNDNVLPAITGAICDHQCQGKCTRMDYEDPVMIRQGKKLASDNAQSAYVKSVSPPALRTDKKAVVIGAGPAGLSAAAYLRRNGMKVTVREKLDRPLGIVSHVIPAFRISDEEISLDVSLASALGVDIEYGTSADLNIEALRAEYDFVILATGAWGQGVGSLKPDGKKVIDALDFLAASRSSDLALDLGARVGIVGGGDVAMDCARAAARNKGVDRAEIVYRRTKAYMPAQREEIELAESDCVVFRELLSPVSFEDGVLECSKMALGEYDESGRRSVVQCSGTESLNYDTIISAVGARVISETFLQNGIATDASGHPAVDENCETSVSGVFACGDCKSGPATVVKAMADAKRAAIAILNKIGLEPDFRSFDTETTREAALAKKGVLTAACADAGDAKRCLSCATVCEICADVCPNRANISVCAGEPFGHSRQIVHLDDICNACGNCSTFCPSAGDPYKDKFTIFGTEESFATSSAHGAVRVGERHYRMRLENGDVVGGVLGTGALPDAYEAMVNAMEKRYPYLLPTAM
jgi:putative selenate reductase